MTLQQDMYPVQFDVNYPEEPLSRVSTFFRPLFVIPIAIVLNALGAVLVLPQLLMIVFRQKYPRWWFDWNLELQRFTHRVWTYLLLLRDEYPSTDEEQSVHLDVAYPDVQTQLNRWLPLVKWFLAIPHYFVLVFLGIAAFFAVIVAWFAILITGRYPEDLFNFVVGVTRWGLRVQAYAFMMVTDMYPPFHLSQ